MQRLDEKAWIDKKIPEVFEHIQRGKRLKNADHVPGVMPYVSSTANNNGVDDYIEATPGTRVFSDCVSLANSGSVGTAFYEPFHYVASDHVTSLKKEGLTAQQYLFLTSVVEKQGVNFNFNREINDARISNMRVLLPVTDNGEPDYAYMECYASEMRGGLLMRYKNYVAERLSELEYKDIPTLNEKEWAEFRIGDRFIVSGTVTTQPYSLGNQGKTPRVTCASGDNGYERFYDNVATEQGGVLTVDSATVGTVTYQPYEFIATDHVEKISLDSHMNMYVGQFMKVAITCSCGGKYQYGYKFSQTRIKRQVVMLPINDLGEPDFEYMEQYSKNMMLRKYQQYLAFLDTKK